MKLFNSRLKEILSVFVRHGLREGLRADRIPRKLRLAFEELGPTFVKIGQILSTRPDLIPEAYVSEFRQLQDNVRPEPFEVICDILEGELGQPLESAFHRFESKAIASASMAQVHLATLNTGQRVVVKIQRPGIRETMERDLGILRRLASVAGKTWISAVIDPSEVLDELWASAQREMDFVIEADNIERFAKNNAGVRYLSVPAVHRAFLTTRVLVLEYVDGIKLNDVKALEREGYDVPDLARKLVDNYFKQVLQDGFFHADPHPGNILVRGPHIVYIDFGIMGAIDPHLQEKFNALLLGVATRDIDAMTQAIIQIGVKKGPVNARRLYSDVEQIYGAYAETPLTEIDITAVMDEAFRAARTNNLAMPRDVILLMRGVMTLEGVVTELAPELNMLEVAIPHVRSSLLGRRELGKELSEQAETVLTLARHGLKLPVKLLELINCTLAGKFRVQTELVDLDRTINELSRMINRVVFGFVVSAVIIASSLLVTARVGPIIFDMPIFGFVGYLGAGFMGIWLLVSILRSGRM